MHPANHQWAKAERRRRRRRLFFFVCGDGQSAGYLHLFTLQPPARQSAPSVCRDY